MPINYGSHNLTTSGALSINNTNIGLNEVMYGRLSLSPDFAAPFNDVTSSTLYYHPNNGNTVSLYDTTAALWKPYSLSSVLTLSISSFAADTNYDIFLYDNNGVLTLEGTAWGVSDAGLGSRSVNISRQNGIYVMTSDPKKRYVGSLRTTTAGTSEDSNSKRFLYNQYNRIPRRLVVNNTTEHTYASSTIRPWNDNTDYGTNGTRVGFIVGFSIESNIDVNLNSDFGNGTVRVGLNSTSLGSCGCLLMINFSGANLRMGCSSSLYGQIGFNYLQILESSITGGTFYNAFMVGNILL